MGEPVFIVLIFSSFLLFVLPHSIKYVFTLFVAACTVAISSWWGFHVFIGQDNHLVLEYIFAGLLKIPALSIDRLSAFFILVINLIVLAGIIFARGYLKPYTGTKRSLLFSIHYFAYLWLYFSMLLVVMLRDGFAFLIVWELMSLSSFLLVIFDSEDRSTLKTGINYLIQMHIGFAFLLVAFLITEKATGMMSFDALIQYFSTHNNLLLFLLFFTGFAIKAGFIPLHTWLPEAHPAAPSHVSAVMSGVMIKMGIYGILRILMSVQSELLLIGTIVLIISLISGVLGVMMAIIQHDLKRLLAYHSIENIGIIGIGIGTGIIGKATGNDLMAVLGLSGGLLHLLNHSLFKSLLFFGAGSVYRSTHTRLIDHLGGLIKKMPYTATFFLIGSLAICGLPPFNGFISEYLIYLGMFKTLSGANLYMIITMLLSIVSLTIIGGLAIFCFTKAFSIVFLGQPRSASAENAKETGIDMLIPKLILVILILAIGLGSVLFVKPIFSLITESYHLNLNEAYTAVSTGSLKQISILGGIFILLIIVLFLYRKLHFSTKTITYGPTWGCGYTAGNFKQQYTATSYADNFGSLAHPILGSKKVFKTIKEKDIFPGKRKFLSHSYDLFKRFMIESPVTLLQEMLKKIAIMQTGQIQHYILYAFVFMLVIFLLTLINVI